MTTVADLFPVRALAEPLKWAVNPFTDGPGLLWRRLAVLAIWLVIGVVVSLRWLRWESQRR